MSRVRVYELAKEAGMSSKALTDKLIELGYDIKGHSSSVDDDTAEKIRNTVLKSANTELVEKRIDSDKEGGTVIRRRATVIRRRAKVKDEPEQTEQTDADAEEAESAESAEAPPVDEKSVKLDEHRPDVEAARIDTGAQRKEEPARVVSSPAPESVTLPEKEIEAKKKEEVEPERAAKKVEPEAVERVEEKKKAQEKTTEDGKEPVAEQAPAVKEVKEVADKKDRQQKSAQPDEAVKKKKKIKTPPQKKPMARVVRTIELPQSEESGGAAPRPKRKPAKGPQQRRQLDGAGQQEVIVEKEGGRNRKKGKRVGFDDDKERDTRRGGKKGQKNVKFTHFGQDYQGRDGGKMGRRGRRMPKAVSPPAEMKASKKRFKVYDTISVGDLAQNMKVKASEVIAKLMGLGVMATINQPVDTDTAMVIAADFGYEVEQGVTEEIGMQMLREAEEGGEQQPRSPVVTVMGHVDHGKTSILDAIRKTDVAHGEAGGITQHIGAYRVRSGAGDVTFVDTPGHAAFTEMRSRGAQVTDIVVLVVAADDGVMDQTREAIHHAQAADVPIIVAVNKIDKDNADIDRVKRELSELNLMPEDWGGETMYCETSAKKNIGIDSLLESIQLLAEILELRADKDRKARGRVIEAQLHKGRGAVATVLIQDGTLHLGEYFVVGQYSGKVRAMLDDKGQNIDQAGPSIPVEVQGLSGVPSAGDEFIVVTDEKMARNVANVRSLKARESELGVKSKISLDKLFEQMSEGDMKELRVVLRSDVQGTLEAFAKAAEDLSTKEIKVKILHEGTGTITESDILLASASDAIIIGFNVRPSIKVKELATTEQVDVRSYDVIYHALDDIRKAMVGLLDPTFEEEVIGLAEVRDTFSVPKVGTIAGCAVLDGKIIRSAKVRVLRDGVVIYTGKIESLRRFKDDVKEVLSGFECGISVEKFNDIKVGDNLEAFIVKEIEATLE
ncbi:bacterial translation initiation factor 2 (bIF-2) [Desulforhopalus singaporensis]|uniref:Translation initiation factor IF-2 n=2 Tax=Desulforhopalus singaporensis TaxID=91360 RepID=A0A1H0J9N3_9BACT|nr:bacterial translation initiation factor 2 (bIF-2) [Desulforhopalus singaporensis]